MEKTTIQETSKKKVLIIVGICVAVLLIFLIILNITSTPGDSEESTIVATPVTLANETASAQQTGSALSQTELFGINFWVWVIGFTIWFLFINRGTRIFRF